MLKVGDKVGMLTLLENKRENKRTYFLCKCDCGNKKWIRSDCIGIEKTISCGCYNRENNYIKAKDIKNKRLGRLIALEPTEQRDKYNGSIIWKCKCDCGNIAFVAEHRLLKGDIKSCGCLGKENSRKNMSKAFAHIKEISYKENTSLILLEPNKKLLKNNTSGVTGVTRDNKKGVWVAQIWFKGKNIYLGKFKNKEGAIKARKEAEIRYFKPILDKYKQ